MSHREFRRGQGIVPFGVGAIIDFPDESLMMAGLDAWLVAARSDAAYRLREATRVHDSRLQARLTRMLQRPIREFFMPPEAPEQYSGLNRAPRSTTLMPDRAPTPFVRFPQWHFCPRCRSMQVVPWNSPGGSDLRCSNGRLRRAGSGKVRPCIELPERRRARLVPVRFVVACPNGHISDFPWVRWAHQGEDGCGTDPGTLFLVSTGGAGLGGLKVECQCGKERTMRGAFSPGILSKVAGRCTGSRPWLGQLHGDPCDEDLQTVQRGSSNIYFAEVVSSILIPPYSERLRATLDSTAVWNEIREMLDGIRVEGQPPPITPEMFQSKARRYGIDAKTFSEGVREKYWNPERWAGEIEESEEGYRRSERNAFMGPRPSGQERDRFDLRRVGMDKYDEDIRRLFSQIVLLPRLRETRALIGFSRLLPYNGNRERLASLSLRDQNWLPAIGINGEGLYLELSADSLRSWARRSPDLVARSNQLAQRRIERSELTSSLAPMSVMLPLVHTLSHLLIRRLSFECGYGSSSLRERLYVADSADGEMAGVLIYTVSGDSEGSLGGLVRQGEPGYFESTLRAAIREAEVCASDPLCRESEGQGFYSLNLAACHACALLPETSCELGNQLLDRLPLVGNGQDGYFSSLLRR